MADPALAMLHEVNSADDWPDEVHDVVRTLHAPLPPLFANFANSTISEFNQFVHSTLSLLDQETLVPEERILAQVSKHVLSTVAALESLASYEAADGLPRPKLPFVYTLIREIAHASASYNRCSFLSDEPFVPPQGCPQHPGVAIALVCRLLGKDDIPHHLYEDASEDEDTEMQDVGQEGDATDTRGDASADGIGFIGWSDLESRLPRGLNLQVVYDAYYTRRHPMYAEERYTLVESDFEVCGPFFYRRKDKDNKATDGKTKLKLPACAHLVTGLAEKSQVALPSYVVADADTIDTLLASVLYQRRVWGIAGPAVGVCISKESTAVRVVLGWLDGEQLNAAGLPLVHIAVGCAVDDGADDGVFDLRTTSGCLRTAYFLATLDCPHLDCDSVTELVRLNWQGGLSGAEENRTEQRTAAHTHALVAHDVNAQEDVLQGPDSLSPSTPSPSTPTISVLRLVTPVYARPHTPSGNSTPPSSSQSSFPLETPPSSPESPLAAQQSANMPPIKASASAKSHSYVAKCTSSIVDEQCGFNAYLWDHNVVTLGRVSLETCPGEVLPADWELLKARMIHYDDIIGLFGDAGWVTDPKGTVPKLWFSKSQHKVFCEQLKRYHEVGGKITPMGDALKRILMPRFENVIISSATQHMLKESANGRPVKEAEIRHVWDQFLLNFFVDDTQVVSPNVFLEYYLQLPRNHLLDRSATVLDDAKKLMSVAVALCKAEANLAATAYTDTIDEDTPYQEELQQRAEDNRDHAWSNLKAVLEERKLIRNVRSAKFMDAVSSRAVEEPIQGICDALCVDRLDIKDRDVMKTYSDYVKSRDIADTLTDTLADFTAQSHQGNGFICKLKTWLGHQERRTKCKLNPKPKSANKPPPPRSSCSLTSLPYVIGRPDAAAVVPASDLPKIQDVLVPTLVVEYKKTDETTAAGAVNQAQSFGCAAVDFREAIGIDPGRPVMILVVDGSRGAINMAWKSKHSGITYILERDVLIVDITQPLQAFQFATFLVRLRTQINEDRQAIADEVVQHFKKTDLEHLKRWTKVAQALETPDLHNTQAVAAEELLREIE